MVRGGFGHVPGGADAEIFTGGSGSTEQFVFIENVAKIELSPEAVAAGLILLPADDGDNPPDLGFDLDQVVETDRDQLINETGLLITNGASPTALNNVFLNLDDSLVEVSAKPQEVIVVGNVFQHADGPVVGQYPNSSAMGMMTSTLRCRLRNRHLQYPEAKNFQPADGSRLIDSSVNSVVERSAVVVLKNSIGLAPSNILTPIT